MGVIGTFHLPPSSSQPFFSSDVVIFMRSVQLQPTGATGTSGGFMCNKEGFPSLSNQARGTENTSGFLEVLEVFTNRKTVRSEERQLMWGGPGGSCTGCSGLWCVCIAPLCVCSCKRLLFRQCITLPKYDFQMVKKGKKVLLLQNSLIYHIIQHKEPQSFDPTHVWDHTNQTGFPCCYSHEVNTCVSESVSVCVCKKKRGGRVWAPPRLMHHEWGWLVLSWLWPDSYVEV